MINRRSVLITLSAFTVLTSILLVSNHSENTCEYAYHGSYFQPCDLPHSAPCKAPAYFSQGNFTDEYYTYERKLYCGWSSEVPTMAYISLGLSIPTIIQFALVVKGIDPKYLPIAFGLGIISMTLLGITGLLMWDDMRLGSSLYADPITGSYYSHNIYYFTFGMVAFLFVAIMILTTQSYKVISQENKKEGHNEEGIQMPFINERH